MISDLDLTGDVGWAAAGVPPGGDKDNLIVGLVDHVDATANRIWVSYKGSDPVPMVGLPGYYAKGQTVFLMRNAITGHTVLCLGPTLGYPAVVLCTLSAIDTTAVRGTVSWQGVTYSLPYIAATYSAGAQVWVQLDPSTFGTPYLIVGPAALPPPPAVQPAPQVAPQAAATVTSTVTVFPEWSGSYRTDQGRWNQWNVGTNGVDALWQGSGYGASGLQGLATYGNRVTDLGATSIVSIQPTLRGANANAASYPLIAVQGSALAAQPSGAPSGAGDTVTGNPGQSGVDTPYLTVNMCNGFQSGAYRGLILVGTGYGAVRGTGSADGMALNITYTRPS